MNTANLKLIVGLIATCFFWVPGLYGGIFLGFGLGLIIHAETKDKEDPSRKDETSIIEPPFNNMGWFYVCRLFYYVSYILMIAAISIFIDAVNFNEIAPWLYLPEKIHEHSKFLIGLLVSNVFITLDKNYLLMSLVKMVKK